MKITLAPFIFALIFIFSCKNTGNNNDIPPYKGISTGVPQQTPSNKTPDGLITGNGDIGIIFGGKPEDQHFYLSKNDLWKAKNGYPDGGVCYLGTLRIKSDVLENAGYQAEQQIGKAQLCANFTQNDYQYLMTAWTSATENIAVIEISGGEKSIPIDLHLTTAEGSGSVNESGQTDGVYWSVRKFDSPELVFQTKVAVAMKVIGANGLNFNVNKNEKVKVLLGFCSNHDNEDYLQNAIDKVKKQSDKSLIGLKQQHESWWSNFWLQSSVSLGDSLLEKYYYGSQYLLACCSRNNSFPPGLWGTSLTMDATAGGWAGDYHTNYNFMAPWWGAYSSNHVQLSDPYDAPILDYMEKAKEHAGEFLHKKGVYFPVGIGPKGFCSSMYPLTTEAMISNYGTPETGVEGGYMFLGQKSNAAFCTTNMFMRFYHTYDREYAEKVYPFIREVADFWEDYLVFENGRYVDYDDNFWEVGPWEGPNYKKGYGDINPTISMGLCRMLFKGIIEMSGFLGRDQDRVEKWEHILAHLSDIPTVQVNGDTRIKACEGGTGSGSRTAPGFGRVMMHGLTFPSGVCGVVTDPAFAKILRDEIYRWDTDTTKYTGWKDATWANMTGGFETYFTSAARVGYDGEQLLQKLKNRIYATALPNLWVPQAGGGTETLSAIPSCINEMLLQGYEGVIRLFPVWPKGKDASFKNLRTHGAFIVSSSCKNGTIENVEILSEKGRLCRIENPWKESGCMVIRENGNKETFTSRMFEIKTYENEKIRLVKNQ